MTLWAFAVAAIPSRIAVANANRIAFCIETSHWVLVSDDTSKPREASGRGCRLLACTFRARLFDRGFHPHLAPEPKRLRLVVNLDRAAAIECAIRARLKIGVYVVHVWLDV
jgi:hypothetical protein